MESFWEFVDEVLWKVSGSLWMKFCGKSFVKVFG